MLSDVVLFPLQLELIFLMTYFYLSVNNMVRRVIVNMSLFDVLSLEKNIVLKQNKSLY